MNNNHIVDEMDSLGADGVDYVPIFTTPDMPNKNIILSRTREEELASDSYPKSGRLYWKIIDGQKVYITKPIKTNYNNCPFREKEDVTPYHGDVFDHPIYAFFCLKDGKKKEITNIKCRNCDYINERGK